MQNRIYANFKLGMRPAELEVLQSDLFHPPETKSGYVDATTREDFNALFKRKSFALTDEDGSLIEQIYPTFIEYATFSTANADETATKYAKNVHFNEKHALDQDTEPHGAEGANQILLKHIQEGLESLAASATADNKVLLEDTIRISPFRESTWGSSDLFERGVLALEAVGIDKDIWGTQQPIAREM